MRWGIFINSLNKITMRFYKVQTGFSSLSAEELEALATSVVNQLTGNKSFPSAQKDVAELGNALPIFSAARQVARQSEAILATIAKDKAAENVVFLLNVLSGYVNSDGRGDLSIVGSAGFKMSAPKATMTITKPEGLTLKNGESSGHLIAKIAKASGVRKYVYEICTAEPTASTIWMRFPDTRKTFTFEDLIPGNKYWVRVSIVNSDGVTFYSDVVSLFVS